MPSVFNDFQAQICVKSPGRINLIGEHTDYNEGFVMPTAINKYITLRFRKNETINFCRIYSETYREGFEFYLDKSIDKQDDWKDYMLGIVDLLLKSNKMLEGFDCMIQSDLPVGAGISSSAALECGFCYGLNYLFDLKLRPLDVAKISQTVENTFVGSLCGIMDQFACVFSKERHFIKLDCRSLEYTHIPTSFKNTRLLLLNTNVSHQLVDSEYNARRRECEAAVSMINQKHIEVRSLRDVSFSLLKQFKTQLSLQTYQRCLYVLEENKRVCEAAKAMMVGDLKVLGKLMTASHRGLQHQYEVSCKELDFMVDYAEDQSFIYGSRMMGGGFGGCTINLIEADHTEAYISRISEAYLRNFGFPLEAITVEPSSGTALLECSRP